MAARASLQRLLPDAKSAADDGAYRREISRPLAWHLRAGAALVSSAAAGRGNRDAQRTDAGHSSSRHRARYREDGIRRLQYRHERRPRALLGGVSDRRTGLGGQSIQPSRTVLEY